METRKESFKINVLYCSVLYSKVTIIAAPRRTTEQGTQWEAQREDKGQALQMVIPPSGAHGGFLQSRTEVDLILTDFDKDKREAIVSLPRKMLVKYTAGNDCQHQKSSTIFNNKKYTEENSV
ncbi:hypothetical protein J6590_087797 [Homalodisca vitripennis]|nr:hypothetical protein J6590_087797 [Homalodisca vitripennis]